VGLEAARALTWARAQQVCEGCGRQRGSQAHHRLPRGMGGTHRAAAGRVNAAGAVLVTTLGTRTWWLDNSGGYLSTPPAPSLTCEK
jgi:hypothetical protein